MYLGCSFGAVEWSVDLACDVALEAADDFGDVVSGGGVPVDSDDGHGVDRFVELAVAAAVQRNLVVPPDDAETVQVPVESGLGCFHIPSKY